MERTSSRSYITVSKGREWCSNACMHESYGRWFVVFGELGLDLCHFFKLFSVSIYSSVELCSSWLGASTWPRFLLHIQRCLFHKFPSELFSDNVS